MMSVLTRSDHSGVMMVVFGLLVEVYVRTVDIAAGTMARSGSSGSESLFGVDLERGSDGGERPVEAMTHTKLAPRALSSVSKGATRRYPWIGSWLRNAQVSHSRKYALLLCT